MLGPAQECVLIFSGHLSSHGHRCSAAARIPHHVGASATLSYLLQMQRRRIPLLQAGAAPAHLSPPHLLPHGSRRNSAALPPSRRSWLRALSLPSAPSLPLAAAPSDAHLEQQPPPPQMTQAAPDLVGKSEEVAARPLSFSSAFG